MADPVVAICTPIGDRPAVQFTRALRMLHKPGGMAHGEKIPGVTHMLDVHGLPVEAARRVLTAQALSVADVTHLLWIDDDMEFPPHALLRLLSWDLPIVGGLCHNRREPYHPILAKKYDPAWGFGDGTYAFAYDYPPDARFEVDATGGAFLLVKREVFETISKYDGPNTWWTPIGTMSEDFSFCERAKRCGFKVHVDTGLEIGHLAEVMITAKRAAALRERQWQRWNPELTPAAVAKGTPRASIVIPVYNQRPKLLKAAVYSALSQTVPVEVIVVDDGSDKQITRDDFGAIGAAGDLHVIRHPENRGISAALNTGIGAMTTEWFCWLSSDDLLDPRKVEYQQAAMAQADAVASFHGYGVIDAEGGLFSRYAVLPEWKNLDEQHAYMSQGCPINGSTVMIRKRVLEEVKIGQAVAYSGTAAYFDPTYALAQDWEMWARIGRKYLWYKVPETLGTRREGGNLTQEIAAEPEGSPRRVRRDEEDRRIREEYKARRCASCGEPVAI